MSTQEPPKSVLQQYWWKLRRYATTVETLQGTDSSTTVLSNHAGANPPRPSQVPILVMNENPAILLDHAIAGPNSWLGVKVILVLCSMIEFINECSYGVPCPLRNCQCSWLFSSSFLRFFPLIVLPILAGWVNPFYMVRYTFISTTHRNPSQPIRSLWHI